MLDKIVYINTFSYGYEHEEFNASLLKICSLVSTNVLCISTRSNFQKMESVLGKVPGNIKYVRNYTIPGKGKYALAFRYVIGAFMDCFYLLTLPKSNVILYSYNNLFGLKLLNWMNRFLKRKVIRFCHNEMEFLSSDLNKKGLLSSLLCYFCINFFDKNTSISDTLLFIVLGDKVKSNLQNKVRESFINHIESIDHPYVFSKDIVKKKYENSSLVFATVGSISVSKGLYHFIEFSKKCKNISADIAIWHIGKVFGNVDNLINANIFVLNDGNGLSRYELNQQMLKVDYILFFYEQNNYKLTASGAIMDAINFEKPIIALKNDYFEYIFEKFGCFGFLVDSVEQMSDVALSLSNNSLSCQCDFKKIKEKLSPENISIEFLSLLKQLV